MPSRSPPNGEHTRDGRQRPGADPESGPHDPVCTVDWTHRLRFTRHALAPDNLTLRDVICPPDKSARRMLVFIDGGVADTWPGLTGELQQYAATHADRITLAGTVIVPGGEAAKNDRSVADLVVTRIHEARLCRHSTVTVIGGGAVLDAVGFAAAIAHRGMRLVRFPTTTLGQADSGVGVKNGINAFGRKNFLGTFAPPWAVINDFELLATLSERDWRCGFSEAVKVALVKDPEFFELLEREAERIRARDMEPAESVIRRSALLHLDHIVSGGDPFELSQARPLDFGHWSAHKLEQMTHFDVRHGEAVAVGVALDVCYAWGQGWIDRADCTRVLRCLRRFGFDLYHPALEDHETLLEGLDEFREHLGGRLTVVMVRGIGRAFDVHEISRDGMVEAIDKLGELAPQCLATGSEH